MSNIVWHQHVINKQARAQRLNQQPCLLWFTGLSGSGKSTIAGQLAAQTGAVGLRIDSRDQAIWASGTAPADLRDWTYRAAQAIMIDNLALGHDVIADCVNDRQEARDG